MGVGLGWPMGGSKGERPAGKLDLSKRILSRVGEMNFLNSAPQDTKVATEMNKFYRSGCANRARLILLWCAQIMRRHNSSKKHLLANQ